VIIYRREQSVDSQTKRSEAVSRLKRDKEAQNKLKELNFKKQKLLTLKGNEAAEELEEEPIERELIILQIQISSRQSIKQLDLTQQELPLLQMLAQKAKEAPSKEQQKVNNLDKLQQQSNVGVKQVANSLNELEKRQQIANGVFKLGWTQPTKSLEQALEDEIAAGGLLKGGTTDSKPKEKDEDDEDDDEKVREARKWDEFNDNNPAGSGNRYRQG